MGVLLRIVRYSADHTRAPTGFRFDEHRHVLHLKRDAVVELVDHDLNGIETPRGVSTNAENPETPQTFVVRLSNRSASAQKRDIQYYYSVRLRPSQALDYEDLCFRKRKRARARILDGPPIGSRRLTQLITTVYVIPWCRHVGKKSLQKVLGL